MDIHFKKGRQLKLGFRDPESIPSPSSLPASIWMARKLTSTLTTLSSKATKPPLPKSTGVTRRATMMDNNGGKGDDEENSSSSAISFPDSNMAPWSALPSGCTINNPRPTFAGCQFLDENDGSLQYSDGWIFSTSDANGVDQTVHFTQTQRSFVSLTFNAPNIVVFGLVPSGSTPPQASYSIDGSIQPSSHIATTSQCAPNQELFNSGNLTAGTHNLTIEVTTASPDQPYILDYLWLCPEDDAADYKAMGPTETHGTTSEDKLLVIAIAVLGIFVLLLSALLCIALLRIRRKSQGEESDREKQNERSTTPTSSETDGRDLVTPFQVFEPTPPPEPPVTPRTDVPTADESSLEATSVWRASNVVTNGDLVYAVDDDRPPSSLVPAPSPRTTILARRLEKVMRFRPPITFRRSSPTSRGNHITGENGVRTKDEPPPPYALT